MPNNKQRLEILAAAKEIFSKKGFAKSSIAEIAGKAGVNDAIIYQHFKNKEDLLFSIPGKWLEESLNLLEEHLQGIPDPESQLSKMIWFHLYYNQTHRSYVRILLLECRSNIDFYESKSYTFVKKYSGRMLRILEDGVKKGTFRNDIDMHLVRNIILGALDFEDISCIAWNELKDTAQDLHNIMALILPMIRFYPSLAKINPKADRILFAAEKIFSEKGYGKSKIADIAKLAEVAEGTVYEYFKNKEDLLLSLSAIRFKAHLSQLEETFEIKNPIRKLRRMIRYHFLLYLTNPDFLKIFLLHIQHNAQFYESKAYKSFRLYYKVIENVIIEGKSCGDFRPDVNPRIFRNLFLGAFSHMAIGWFILGKELKADKYKEIEQVTELLTATVLPYKK